MENNEIMNEGFEMVEDVVMDNNTGFGTGKAMLIGAGLTIAVCAGIKLAKKAYQNYKAKKELRRPDKETLVEESDIEHVAGK